MKLNLDFDNMERQWKMRQLDLFPWLDGLFALIRTRESLTRETRRRLSSSSTATMVQFLSSDDQGNALVARETIKEQDPETILPLLLYSLEKVEKDKYPRRVMESLLDFDPAVSFGYFLGFMNERTKLKERLLLLIEELFPLPSDRDAGKFLVQFFHALGQDLEDRMPPSGRLQEMEDFDCIRPDLRVVLSIFSKTWQGDHVPIVEKEMQRIGREVIHSLSGLHLALGNGPVLGKQLSEIIPFMALLRLEADASFLKRLPAALQSSFFTEEEKEDLIRKSDVALTIIHHPERRIHEIMDQCAVTLFVL